MVIAYDEVLSSVTAYTVAKQSVYGEVAELWTPTEVRGLLERCSGERTERSFMTKAELKTGIMQVQHQIRDKDNRTGRPYIDSGSFSISTRGWTKFEDYITKVLDGKATRIFARNSGTMVGGTDLGASRSTIARSTTPPVETSSIGVAGD
ncbi:hypothetical protein BDY21DRAFT_363404 [Lineolata rhizophorae]|uniref:Uncharacterized protein n=1 Tax=Lineolata rhizophorae TaxID=578093 RepID=A0A6A6P1Y7_9PEZI|nr:hypothetical protein BDY21DRAFT_363404 [Lineolata rhizophorae]